MTRGPYRTRAEQQVASPRVKRRWQGKRARSLLAGAMALLVLGLFFVDLSSPAATRLPAPSAAATAQRIVERTMAAATVSARPRPTTGRDVEPRGCTPGAQVYCKCRDGRDGTRTCDDAGVELGKCSCAD